MEAELDQVIGPRVPRVWPRHLRGTLGGREGGRQGRGKRERRIGEKRQEGAGNLCKLVGALVSSGCFLGASWGPAEAHAQRNALPNSKTMKFVILRKLGATGCIVYSATGNITREATIAIRWRQSWVHLESCWRRSLTKPSDHVFPESSLDTFGEHLGRGGEGV